MRKTLVLVTVAALSAAAFAQPNDIGRRDGFGRGPGGPGGPGGGPPTPGRMLERMAEMLRSRLNLDEQQQAELDEIVAAIREGVELNGESTDLRSVFEEMRAAREAGDEERVNELREQMRGRFRQMGETVSALFDQVEPILNEEQAAQLAEMRERMRQRTRDGDPRRRAQEAIRELRSELDLTDEQAAQFDELVEGLRLRGREMGERMGEMRSVFEELRAAREAGDTEKVEQLRAQLEEMRPNPRAWLEEFLDSVEQLVGPEQADIVQKYRDRLAEAAPGRGQPRELDPRAIIAATRRLDLTPEQREKLRQLEAEAGRAYREIRREAEAVRAEFIESFKHEVMSVLTEEQTAEFERLLEQGGRDRGRDGRRRGDAPRDRRPRPAPDADTP